MKISFFLMCLLISSVIKAEVFKCTGAGGKTFYQDKPCPEAAKSEAMEIAPQDQQKYFEARERLSQDLKDYAEYEHMEAQEMREEREVSAMERNAQANEDMAKALLREQEAIEAEDIYNDGVYFSPGYYYPYYAIPSQRRPFPHSHPGPGPRQGPHDRPSRPHSTYTLKKK